MSTDCNIHYRKTMHLLLTSRGGLLPGSEIRVLTECENVRTRILMIAQTAVNELLWMDKTDS